VKLFPFRALRSLSSSRLLRSPACRLALRLPVGFWSLQRHPSEEPLVETRRPVRASVPLSGFRNPSAVSSNSEFRGLVSCRNRSWDPPFRAFPSQRSPTPLEAACSPAVIHPRAVVHRLTPYHRRFLRTPALSRDRPLPPTTMDSLLKLTEISLPGCPGRQATGSPRLASFICFEASCSLRESVHRANQVAPIRRAVALLGFFPSNAFSAHASDPLTRPSLEGPNTLRRPKAPVHDARDLSAPRAGCDPPTAIEITASKPRRQLPALFRAGPHHLSVAHPPPMALVPRASPGFLTFGVSKCARSSFPPEGGACASGVSYLFAFLVTSAALGSWLIDSPGS